MADNGKNPWYKEYGVIGTIAAILILSNVSVHVNVGQLKTDVALVKQDIVSIKEQMKDIPPPEQKAHNDKVDSELLEVKRELEKLEQKFDLRLTAVIGRFHQIIPKLLEVLDKISLRLNRRTELVGEGTD